MTMPRIEVMSALILTVVLTGCAAAPHVATSDPEYTPVRPVYSEPLPVRDGAIYKTGYSMNLFTDVKARRVGDIITIMLQESTSASKSATTNTAKSSSIDLAAPTVFGSGVIRDGVPILSAAVDSARDFAGEGDSEQSNSLNGLIAVHIVEVLPNGNLMVRGEKLLTLNQGSEHIRISGIIRPEDITPENTVRSAQVANAKIIYGGQGVLADANSKGWMHKFFDSSWWPF